MLHQKGVLAVSATGRVSVAERGRVMKLIDRVHLEWHPCLIGSDWVEYFYGKPQTLYYNTVNYSQARKGVCIPKGSELLN